MRLARLLLQLLPALSAAVPMAGAVRGDMIRGLMVQVVLAVGALAIVAVAAGFGIAACYMALEARLGSPAAAGLVACGLLVLAGVLLLIMASVARRQARRRRKARLEAQRAAMLPVNQLMGSVTANPLRSLLVATAAGLLTGWLDRKR